MYVHGVWAPLKPYAYYIFEGIRVCVKRRIYLKALKKLVANFKIYIYVMRIWPSPLWRANLHLMFNDFNGESMCTPWEGIVMCLV